MEFRGDFLIFLKYPYVGLVLNIDYFRAIVVIFGIHRYFYVVSPRRLSRQIIQNYSQSPLSSISISARAWNPEDFGSPTMMIISSPTVQFLFYFWLTIACCIRKKRDIEDLIVNLKDEFLLEKESDMAGFHVINMDR